MTKPVTDETTGEKARALIPQAHGGALLDGGVPGNRGNRDSTGRPPSVVRSIAREAWASRIPTLEAIADGQVINKARVPMATVLRYARCPECDTSLEATDAVGDLTIEGTVSASAGEMVRAMSELSKVGLGPTLSADDVKERIVAMVGVISARDTWTKTEVLDAISPIWK